MGEPQRHGAPSDEPTSWGTPTTSIDDSTKRQRRLWELTMRARYVGIVALAALIPFTDELGDSAWLAVVALLFVALPYNAVFDVLMRRQHRLWPAMAFVDQLLAVTFLAAFDAVFASLLLVMLALDATTAVAFGRRTAEWATALGVLGATVVALSNDVQADTTWLLVYIASAVFVVIIVGTVSEVERDLRSRHAELIGGIDAVVWEQVTVRPSTLFVNSRAESMLGYPVADWTVPGFWRSHVHPEDVDVAARAYRDAIRRGQNSELEYRMVAADGRVVEVQDHMRVEVDDVGRPVHVRGVMLDITEAKAAEAQARQYLNLVDRIALALLVLRPSSDREVLEVVAINPEAARVCDVAVTDAVGRPGNDVLSMLDDHVLDALHDVAATGEPFASGDVRVITGSGGRRVLSLFAFPLPDGAVGVSIQDVTDRAMSAEALRRQALHDALTGLPNRAMLLERLRTAIDRTDATGELAALLVLDLNQFKDVNDALGHERGDRLLIEMSRRLQRVLRDVDTIARLGGDEFAVLLSGGTDPEAPVKVATTIHGALEEPFSIDDVDIQTSASIGIARHPDHGADAETLIQLADVAMYTAKRGRSGTAVYADELDRSSKHRLSLLGELRKAIHDGELELHYQPSLDLRTGRVGAVEALVRWRHPEHGMIPPIDFIELAEISGLINDLTRWVVTRGVGQAREWADAGMRIRVSLNLSVRNLADPELVPWLEALLARDGVDASLVKLEITESELMDDPAAAMEVLQRLRNLGAATSIDDFGTGYSSLAYLSSLPIDELKIDKSFVDPMLTDASAETIVRSTIDLAHNLGMEVVAEGVEDGQTLARLALLGCDRAQGYFVARPLPADVCTAWLADDSMLDESRACLPTP